MRKYFIAAIILFTSLTLHAQNVGIGTSTPLARFQVVDSNVLFTGPPSFGFPSNTPFRPSVEGSGSRMLWYAQKAAFRAGLVNGTQWDKDSIGRFSFASGIHNKAKGEASFAMGSNNSSLGLNSTVFGYNSSSSGFASFSTGGSNTAIGDYSVVGGNLNSASGRGATSFGEINSSTGELSFTWGNGSSASGLMALALGNFAEARSTLSTAIGYGAVAQGGWSFAAGYRANTIAQLSAAIGWGVKSRSQGSVVVGMFNDTSNTNRVFEVGNGSDENVRSNALTILNNGNIGIGTTNPTRPLSFQPFIGEKILLYPGINGEVGIGVYGNELRLHCDNPGSIVSFGTQDNAGNFTQAARAQITGGYAFIVNGSIWANGVTYASDARFKTNITSISSPLEKVLRLNGVEYDMNREDFQKNNFSDGRQIGLLAQNVEAIVPEAVSELDGYKSVDYAKLVPLLIESIKELKKEIEELKKGKR
jgi:Chaperone of endosialidase